MLDWIIFLTIVWAIGAFFAWAINTEMFYHKFTRETYGVMLIWPLLLLVRASRGVKWALFNTKGAVRDALDLVIKD